MVQQIMLACLVPKLRCFPKWQLGAFLFSPLQLFEKQKFNLAKLVLLSVILLHNKCWKIYKKKHKFVILVFEFKSGKNIVFQLDTLISLICIIYQLFHLTPRHMYKNCIVLQNQNPQKYIKWVYFINQNRKVLLLDYVIIRQASITPSCSGPIPAQKKWVNLVPEAVLSHTMPQMDFHYSHRFSREKTH